MVKRFALAALAVKQLTVTQTKRSAHLIERKRENRLPTPIQVRNKPAYIYIYMLLSSSKMARDRNILSIVGFFLACVAFFFTVVAFSTTSWLESFREADTRFVKLGLWSACFNNFVYSPNYEQKIFDGCGWIFSYDYRPIYDWLIPSWFLVIQIMMTLAMVVLFITCMLCLVGLLGFCPPHRAGVAQVVNSFLIIFCAILVTISVIIFGAKSDDGQWIPQPKQNYLSWSFGLAVVAAFFLIFSWMCLLVDSIRIRAIKRREATPPSYIECRRNQSAANYY